MIILMTTKDDLDWFVFDDFQEAVKWFEDYAGSDLDKFKIDHERQNIELAYHKLSWTCRTFGSKAAAVEFFYDEIIEGKDSKYVWDIEKEDKLIQKLKLEGWDV